MCMLQNVYTFAYFKQDFYKKSDSETFIDLDLLQETPDYLIYLRCSKNLMVDANFLSA